MIVKSVNGTTENTCHCESWLDHWKKYSGQRSNFCVVRGCCDKPEVGGHVQECGATNEQVYVIPLCRACRDKKGQELVIFDGVNLVPADIADTCGREQRQEHAAAG